MRASLNDPLFSKTWRLHYKTPFFLYSSPNDPPIFLLSSLKDPIFLYLVCHRKTPTLGVLSPHPRHFHMWVPPPYASIHSNICCPGAKKLRVRGPVLWIGSKLALHTDWDQNLRDTPYKLVLFISSLLRVVLQSGYISKNYIAALF